VSDLTYDSFTSHDGLPIAYRVNGSGRPVVLIHGYSVTSTVNFATHYTRREDGQMQATAGPTIESALLDAGFQAVMFDLRGHGHSAKPHDPSRYSMDAHVGDVTALVEHLSLDRPAVVGYSLGAMIAGRLLTASWVATAALCGAASDHVEGEDQPLLDALAIGAQCFIEGCWDDHPDLGYLRMWATLDPNPDFLALAEAGRGARGTPKEILKAATMPVLILNGPGDESATHEYDLSPFIPGARRAVAGDGDHGTAPSDPLFQAELVRFLQVGH
jgi:pimeloyl-ACP methyl ester carboxylesterase